MAEYKIEFVTSAAKEFRSLPANMKKRVSTSVDSLGQKPRPDGVKKLQGHEELYRIRVGVYRVVYEIDDSKKLIRVTRVRHRSEAYR
ncbi:MAG: type II toxin-antitoxin system RelE/ParE family toxin [Chloroflexi bacterium]|nr:type II toxin-antitoxin system RelE/ParE family toxin [Chloroflexota bacterium]